MYEFSSTSTYSYSIVNNYNRQFRKRYMVWTRERLDDSFDGSMNTTNTASFLWFYLMQEVCASANFSVSSLHSIVLRILVRSHVYTIQFECCGYESPADFGSKQRAGLWLALGAPALSPDASRGASVPLSCCRFSDWTRLLDARFRAGVQLNFCDRAGHCDHCDHIRRRVKKKQMSAVEVVDL